ncbi:ribonuclease P protein subunit [Candidatus Woesearchaeota archaeon]|nr:ribonuclease P protein subunit [Candidatus Woesearchaeota archaeon]
MKKIISLTQCFIGKKMIVVESKNNSFIGTEGIIIDETKNLFKVDTGKKTISLIKNNIIFKIGSELINGDSLSKNPEDRIKMRIKNE